MPGPDTVQNAAAFSPGQDDVFARIAGRYDFLCDVFSLGIHRLWKSRMATRIVGQPATLILDVASGTGDIPLRVRRQLANGNTESTPRTMLVSDLCPEMLAIAKAKLGSADPMLEFAQLDAHDLRDVAAGSVDLYSISFAMKICERQKVLSEALRVLKPGGWFFCLEAARIPNEAVHAAYLAYMSWCLPLIGWIAARGDRGAYDYLLQGIREFPPPLAFAMELEAHGFEDVTFETLTFGIVALHLARKPAD